MKRVALFVGVADYDEKRNGFGKLDCTVSDAVSIHDFFTKQDFTAPPPLINPRKGELKQKILDLTDDLKANDQFLFYFSGHGITQDNQHRLICVDDCSKEIHEERLGVGVNLIERVAEEHGCHCTVIVDSCRSDTLVGVKGSDTKAKDMAALRDLGGELTQDEGSLAVLCSCREHQSSVEVREEKCGAFTMALRRVLARRTSDHKAVRINDNFVKEINHELRDILHKLKCPQRQTPWVKATGDIPKLIDGEDTAEDIREREREASSGPSSRPYLYLIALLALMAGGSAFFAWRAAQKGPLEISSTKPIPAAIKDKFYILAAKAGQASERNKAAKYADIPAFRKTSLELEAYFRSGKEAAKRGDYADATNFFTKVGVNARWLIEQTALRKKSLSAQQSAKDALASAISANAARHAPESFCKGTNQLALATAFLDRGEFGKAASSFGECASLLVAAKDVADKATRTEQERQHAIDVASEWRSRAEKACAKSEEDRYSEVQAFTAKIAECKDILKKGKQALDDENFGTATNHFAACIAVYNWLADQSALRATALEWQQTVRKSRENIENAELQSYADKAYSAAVAGIEKADGLLETGKFAEAQRVYATANKVFGRIVEIAEKAKREEAAKAAEAAREAEVERLCAEDGYTRKVIDGKPFAQWIAGKIHPRNNDLVTDNKERSWVSRKAGYVWDGEDGLRWTPGLRYPQFPHWISGDREGSWDRDKGYTAQGGDAPFPARLSWVPGVEFGNMRTGYAEGSWQHKVNCASCRGGGTVQRQSDCPQCNGSGRITDNETCASCNGRGAVSVANRCAACRGTGQLRSNCNATGAIKRGSRIICQHGCVCPSCQGQGMVQNTAANVANALGGLLTAIGSRGRQRPRRQQTQMVRCSTCNGGGWVQCTACGGSRYVTSYCQSCSGTGKVSSQSTCNSCRGVGSHPKTYNCTNCNCGKVHSTEPCPNCSGSGFEWK